MHTMCVCAGVCVKVKREQEKEDTGRGEQVGTSDLSSVDCLFMGGAAHPSLNTGLKVHRKRARHT